MCKFPTNWNPVKVLAYVELAVTILTLSVMEYAYIINRKLFGETKSLNTQDEETEDAFNSTKAEENEVFEYIGRILVVLGFGGMFGILFCVATVLTEKLDNFSSKGRGRIVRCWFRLNAFTMIILTFLWGGLICYAVLGNERASVGLSIQILFGICYALRCPVIFRVWKLKKSVIDECNFAAVVDMEN